MFFRRSVLLDALYVMIAHKIIDVFSCFWIECVLKTVDWNLEWPYGHVTGSGPGSK